MLAAFILAAVTLPPSLVLSWVVVCDLSAGVREELEQSRRRAEVLARVRRNVL